MRRYLVFRLTEEKRKTKVWVVRESKHGDILGTIQWYSPWRQYVFWTFIDTVFSWDYLKAISKFLKKVNLEHKKKWCKK